MRVVNLSERWTPPLGGAASRRGLMPREVQQTDSTSNEVSENEQESTKCTVSARCKFIRGMGPGREVAIFTTSARCKFIRGIGPAQETVTHTASARCKFIRGMGPAQEAATSTVSARCKFIRGMLPRDAAGGMLPGGWVFAESGGGCGFLVIFFYFWYYLT